MRFVFLIAQSKNRLLSIPTPKMQIFTKGVFTFGAQWMFEKLNEGFAGKRLISKNFEFYGFLKYGISFWVFLLSAYFFSKIHISLIPISIIVFYISEIHFLFLFPLLLDDVKKPIFTSIKLTYQTGFFLNLINVIPIGVYMVLGLFNYKDPFRNWYIGCLAILIWYQDEIRNRL